MGKRKKEKKILTCLKETGTFIQRKGRWEVEVTQYYLNILLLKLQIIYIKLSYRTLVCQLDQCTCRGRRDATSWGSIRETEFVVKASSFGPSRLVSFPQHQTAAAEGNAGEGEHGSSSAHCCSGSHPEPWGNFSTPSAGWGLGAWLTIVLTMQLWCLSPWPLVADAAWGNSCH